MHIRLIYIRSLHRAKCFGILSTADSGAVVPPPPSHGVYRYLDLKARGRIGQHCPDVVLKEIPDPVELHDIPGLGAEPELVKLNEEVRVEVMKMFQGRDSSPP